MSNNPFADTDASHCAGCRRLLGKKYITVEGQHFHRECFTCCDCGHAIPGKYYNIDAGFRCEGCQEARKPRCVVCKEAIKGKHAVVEGQAMHHDCFKCRPCGRPIKGPYFSKDGAFTCAECQESAAPKCAGCKRPVLGPRTTTDSDVYHPECFACSECKSRIAGPFFTSSLGHLLCEKCNEVQNPAQLCASCGQPIHGQFASVGGAAYHPECFCCCQCNVAIKGPFVHAPGGRGFLCGDCQPRCEVCREPLVGRESIRAKGRVLHAACFRCCDCGEQIRDGHFDVEASPTPAQRCRECHMESLRRVEAAKETENVDNERRRTRTNSDLFCLFWRPELVPSSRKALKDLGVADLSRLLPRGSHVCICHDVKKGWVGFAPSPAERGAAVNVAYLATALKVLQEYGREPQFSLDPSDPRQISGDMQVKRFMPEWLAGSVVGEVLFQADYALKEVCFGECHAPGIEDLVPNVFDEAARENEAAMAASESPSDYAIARKRRQQGEGERSTGGRAARSWFTIRRAGIALSSDGVLMPRVAMGVEARRLVPGPKGLEDAPYTDSHDPFVRQAAVVTEKFSEVAKLLPAVAELVSLARAVVTAVYLLERGCRCDKRLLSKLQVPEVPEGRDGYCMKIPTLTKERRSATIDSSDGGQVQISTHRRTMHGGVDLSIPKSEVTAKPTRPVGRSGIPQVKAASKKVPTKAVPEVVLESHVKPSSLPLFY